MRAHSLDQHSTISKIPQKSPFRFYGIVNHLFSIDKERNVLD